jgi:hypothetical protein
VLSRAQLFWFSVLVLVGAIVAIVVEFRDVVEHQPNQVRAARFAEIRPGASYREVERLLQVRPLASAVYQGGGFLVQCWYYDRASPAHFEVCFNHFRVIHKQRYR